MQDEMIALLFLFCFWESICMNTYMCIHDNHSHNPETMVVGALLSENQVAH